MYRREARTSAPTHMPARCVTRTSKAASTLRGAEVHDRVAHEHVARISVGIAHIDRQSRQVPSTAGDRNTHSRPHRLV